MGWLVMFMALLVWLPNHCAGLDGSFGLISCPHLCSYCLNWQILGKMDLIQHHAYRNEAERRRKVIEQTSWISGDLNVGLPGP